MLIQTTDAFSRKRNNCGNQSIVRMMIMPLYRKLKRELNRLTERAHRQNTDHTTRTCRESRPGHRRYGGWDVRGDWEKCVGVHRPRHTRVVSRGVVQRAQAVRALRRPQCAGCHSATLLARIDGHVQVLDKHRVTSGARLAVVGHMQVVSTQCVRGA